MFEVRNLAFSYAGRPVLRNVSFGVAKGEIVAVVGANGAGKTTLLKVLASLAVPSSGCVLLDGSDVFSRPLAYRRQLGYAPETPALYDDMTVKEYLRYRAKLRGETFLRIRRRVQDAAAVCGLDNCLRTVVGNLSAGQRRRVALADALMLRPRVLLLDDFLSGLDRGMRDSIGSVLQSAAAYAHVIATGHETAEFARWSTRVLELRDGKIAPPPEASDVLEGGCA